MFRADSRFPFRRIVGAWVVALVLLGGGSAARAQSPVITPAGDPSVRSDTIYALVVDSAQHREESYIWLLDDGVVRVEADGTGVRTYRQVIQLLQPSAVEDFAEMTFGYDADREELLLNWARVVGLNGKVISEKPIQSQLVDQPAAEQSPVYTRRKTLRISLGSVAPGTIVDYSYTLRVKTPVLKGNFYSNWTINPGTIRRSRLILDAPEGVAIKLKEENLDFTPVVQRVKGRVIRTWARSNLEHRTPEIFATSDSNKVIQAVTASGPIGWPDVARWYAGLVRGRYAVSPAVETRLAQVVAGARTRADSLRALHRWIAQDIRYLSISLGIGGYQPRLPEDVVQTASGDCKDKATLFVALARRLGYEAYPVIARSVGWAEQDVPAIEQFNHMIAAVRVDSGWTFVDLTESLVPFGPVPPAVTGDFGLRVRDDGTFEEVRFPRPAAEANRSSGVTVGTVDEAGHFEGWFTRTLTGATQYKARGRLSEPFTATERAAFAQAVAGSVVEGARADSLELFDGHDLAATPRIRVHIVADGALKQGSAFVLPLPRYGSHDNVGALEREKPRQFPFASAAVVGAVESYDELRLTLPAGWSVDLPRSVSAESAFGAYQGTYALNGREVVVSRRLRGNARVLPPTSKAELIAWMKKVGEDDVSFLMLRPPAAKPATTR